MSTGRERRTWPWLLIITAILVLVGCLMYATGLVGWAQFMWVIASGTAGGFVVALITEEDRR